MAGLVPAIHALLADVRKKDVDARGKRGHDDVVFYHIVKTWTTHKGFLPHCTATAARTPRLTASATESRSRRRARGRLSIVSTAASWTTSSNRRPSAVSSGMPIDSTTGSPATAPLLS